VVEQRDDAVVHELRMVAQHLQLAFEVLQPGLVVGEQVEDVQARGDGAPVTQALALDQGPQRLGLTLLAPADQG
jgi:hypothetical protein